MLVQYSRSINVSYLINRLNEKNHIIRLIDAKKAFDSGQHSFITKALSKL
jgi:hypothetical protein